MLFLFGARLVESKPDSYRAILLAMWEGRQLRISALVACFLFLVVVAAGCGEPAATPTPGPALTLDQSQTSIPGNTGLEEDWWLSQGFIPSMPVLTSVDVYVGSVHADLTSPLVLQIRTDHNGLPSDTVLASTSVSIAQKAWEWITLDLPDLTVNPGTSYHLVLSSVSNYHVGLDSTNPYPDGHMGYSTDAGATWKTLHDTPNYDMAFKIYGTASEEITRVEETEKPPPTTAPAPEFELKSWQAFDDNGVAVLEVVCYSSTDIYLTLYQPDGHRADYESITGAQMRSGSGMVELALAGGYSHVTPLAGTYNLVVTEKRMLWASWGDVKEEETICIEKLTFGGAKLRVADCSPTLEYRPIMEDYVLEGLTISLTNEGDLPGYVTAIFMSIDGKVSAVTEMEGVVPNYAPGQSETFYVTDWVPGLSEGPTINLTLKDSVGNIVATYP